MDILAGICRPGPLADQAAQQIDKQCPNLSSAPGSRGTRDAADPRFACQLLEALSEFQLLPFAANEPELQPTLVPVPEPKKRPGTATAAAPTHTHACFGVHFGSGFPTAAAVLAGHVQATRQRLLWELRDFGAAQGAANVHACMPCRPPVP